MKVELERVKALDERLRAEAEQGGYNLNPDREWTMRLCDGLLVNESRYGYRACPCRLASGDKEQDLDIICPCDYRDADLMEYGACYCGLYVSDEVFRGEKPLQSVPERRPFHPLERRPKSRGTEPTGEMTVWRCRVCGYLCAREQPPAVCPICKAKAERFEVFAFPLSTVSV